VIVALGLGIYYGRYFFTNKVVKEESPILNTSTENQILKQGSFEEIDFIHKGSGNAMLLSGQNGQKVLRLENFQVTNGPDLYVYLSRNPQPNGDTNSLGDFINLGRLKGNMGNQNYEINQNIDGYDTVVIWCQQFGVLFSFAVLR